MCLQGGITGTCVASPSSERKWCACPDGVLSGDGLAGERTATVDAGPNIDAADTAGAGANAHSP
jgi:hypothetical protein